MGNVLSTDQLLTITEKNLLISGGVDNWDGYGQALESYVSSSDEYEDAINFLDALDSTGVNNWDGYSMALSGFSGYAKYLSTLDDNNVALSFQNWTAQAQNDNNRSLVSPSDVVEPKREPVTESDSMVYNHIVKTFGSEVAMDLFTAAVENGIFKRVTFPKEFDKAVKFLKNNRKGSSLEESRKALIESVTANGKLDVFLNNLKVS